MDKEQNISIHIIINDEYSNMAEFMFTKLCLAEYIDGLLPNAKIIEFSYSMVKDGKYNKYPIKD